MLKLSIAKRHATSMAQCAVAALVILSAPTAAQERDVPAPLEPLKTCQAEVDPTARLACFDRATAEMLAASAAGDLRVIDREEIKKTRRGLFGFSLPDFGIFGRGDDEEDQPEEEGFDLLNTTIAGVSGSHGGSYLVTTAEGAVWRLDEQPRMSPKVGQSVEIRNGALSSYYLRIDGRSGVKGHRVR